MKNNLLFNGICCIKKISILNYFHINLSLNAFIGYMGDHGNEENR